MNIIMFFTLFLMLFGLSSMAQSQIVKLNDYVADELLVQFKPTTLRALRQNTMLGLRAQRKNNFNRMAIEHWKLPTGTNLDAVIQQLNQNPAVAFVEPNYRRHLRAVPNDPLFGQQWGLQNTGQFIADSVGGNVTGLPNADMGLSRAWNNQTGSKNVVVAVIDDSVDIHHPDLSANIWRNAGEIANDGIDNDGNGYVDDISGWDFVNNDADPSTDLNRNEGHGTLVAGCVGAVGNNGLGVSGVNWRVSIMAIKAGTDVASELLAFQYAMSNGAQIVNASWGGPQFSRAESTAVQLLQNAGILLVTAAGNYNTNNDMIPDYPSSLANANVISVGGSDPSDQLVGFSHYGAVSVDLVAPGLSIYTTASPNAGIVSGGSLYAFSSGTSFSAPYVSGVAALLKAQFPKASFQELKGRILAGVTPITSLQGVVASSGRLNAANALTVAVQPVLMIHRIFWKDGFNQVPDPNEVLNMDIVLENVWKNATAIRATLVPLSANVTVLQANTTYPDLNTDTYASPRTPFQIKINNNATGQQTYQFRLDIQAAGGYVVSRYYQLIMGTLKNGVAYQGQLMVNAMDDVQFFHIDVPAGVGSLHISTIAGRDLDLLVRVGGVPQFDYQLMIQAPNDPFAVGLGTLVSSTLGSGNENKVITNPAAGTWYMALANFDSAATNYPYTLTATYSGVSTAVAAVGSAGKSGCLMTVLPSQGIWFLLLVFFMFWGYRNVAEMFLSMKKKR